MEYKGIKQKNVIEKCGAVTAIMIHTKNPHVTKRWKKMASKKSGESAARKRVTRQAMELHYVDNSFCVKQVLQ